MNFQSNQKVIYVLVAALVFLIGVSVYLVFASQQYTPNDAGVSGTACPPNNNIYSNLPLKDSAGTCTLDDSVRIWYCNLGEKIDNNACVSNQTLCPPANLPTSGTTPISNSKTCTSSGATFYYCESNQTILNASCVGIDSGCTSDRPNRYDCTGDLSGKFICSNQSGLDGQSVSRICTDVFGSTTGGTDSEGETPPTTGGSTDEGGEEPVDRSGEIEIVGRVLCQDSASGLSLPIIGAEIEITRENNAVVSVTTDSTGQYRYKRNVADRREFDIRVKSLPSGTLSNGVAYSQLTGPEANNCANLPVCRGNSGNYCGGGRTYYEGCKLQGGDKVSRVQFIYSNCGAIDDNDNGVITEAEFNDVSAGGGLPSTAIGDNPQDLIIILALFMILTGITFYKLNGVYLLIDSVSSIKVSELIKSRKERKQKSISKEIRENFEDKFV